MRYREPLDMPILAHYPVPGAGIGVCKPTTHGDLPLRTIKTGIDTTQRRALGSWYLGNSLARLRLRR